MRGLLVLAATALLLAGCSAREGAAPVTEWHPTTTTGTAETTTTTTAPTTTTTVSRPKNLDIAGTNVCQVLTGLPVADWGIDPSSQRGGDSSLFPGSQDCFGQGDNIGLTLIAVKDQGAREYIEDGVQAQITEMEVRGYRVSVLRPSDPSNCFGAIDVNDNQMLYVNYGVSIPDEQPVTPQATLCQRVPEIATAVLGLVGG